MARMHKKSQAAIEFLMTYGWMLLVVLIVGALVFSFVDFSSLLPNRLDLTNMLKGDAAGSVVTHTDGTQGNDQGLAKLVVTNIAGRRVLLNATKAYIKTELGGYCIGTNVTNVDAGTSSSEVSLLNGQTAVVTFDCDDGGTLGNAPTLYAGDILQGDVHFVVRDPKTKIDIPIDGVIRIKIS